MTEEINWILILVLYGSFSTFVNIILIWVIKLVSNKNREVKRGIENNV